MKSRPKPSLKRTLFWIALVSPSAIVGIGVCIVLSAYVRSQRHPTFPARPGTNVIVFTTKRDPGRQLYAMYPDGSQQTRITYLAAKTYWWWPAAWTPYADLIVNTNPQPYRSGVAFMANLEAKAALYNISLDGSILEPIPTPNQVLDNRTVMLSPDGQRIAFVRTDGALAVINTDGSDERCLTCDIPARAYTPAWSPDGRRLAFAMSSPQKTYLYLINVDGLQLTRLENAADATGADPAWAPDGQRLVFASSRDGNGELYTINIDGTQLTRLTFTADNEAQPAWSPDGTQIAYAVGRTDGKQNIYVMNADGSAQKRLTTTDRLGDSNPTWVHIPSESKPQ